MTKEKKLRKLRKKYFDRFEFDSIKGRIHQLSLSIRLCLITKIAGRHSYIINIQTEDGGFLSPVNKTLTTQLALNDKCKDLRLRAVGFDAVSKAYFEAAEELDKAEKQNE